MSRLDTAIEERIAEATGTRGAVRSRSPVSGGCIHQASVLELDDGRRFFLKSGDASKLAMFESEEQGLTALRLANALRVPETLGCGTADGRSYIVMEYIPPGRPGAGFFEDFGRRLALLHRQAKAPLYGFEADNFIGAGEQPNGWMEDWPDFWRLRRLGFQLELASRKGLADAETRRLGTRLLDRLGDLLGPDQESPSLIHGDLWSGNFLCSSDGEPVLVDPAVYFGVGEAELAMCRLFGGFSPAFFAAYRETSPPERPGAEIRGELYRLYHLLNHWNLFGGGYADGCLRILRRYA